MNGKIIKIIATTIGNSKKILQDVEMVADDLKLSGGYCGSKSGLVYVTIGQPTIKISKILAEPFPFVRVDFFNLNGRVYFGEFTFYDWAGLKAFVDDEWDRKLGSWINLPK